jgi:DNA-binding NtrC family response regulator
MIGASRDPFRLPGRTKRRNSLHHHALLDMRRGSSHVAVAAPKQDAQFRGRHGRRVVHRNGTGSVDVSIAVLRATDAFAALWTELIEGAGAVARDGATVAELMPLGNTVGVLVAAGGDEAAALPALRELRETTLAPVVVVGAAADHRLAIGLMRGGASDYLVLPGELGALRGWARERVETVRARESARALAAYEREQYDFSRLIGDSEGLRAALARASRVIGRGQATVLITGETGTGKELLAQAIHYNGPRAARPLVQVNCTALPASLLEAELFGYEKGAFTGATAPKPGLFEAADGGTLFLDEIGDLTVDLQAKLLRALEQREVRRLGSVRPVTVDVRIMAATHVDLAAAVREGRFREDLYYRLSVVPIHLPPLRERGDDVILLASAFTRRLGEEYGLGAPELTNEVKAALRAHPWHGNIRELRNAIERALLLGDGRIHVEDLMPREAVHASTVWSPIPFPARMDDIERSAAEAMVARLDGNKTAAASALGISRSRLYRLIGEGDPDAS